jgi:hypothetical protein
MVIASFDLTLPAPWLDRALRLASKITQVSDRLVRSANNKGETP